MAPISYHIISYHKKGCTAYHAKKVANPWIRLLSATMTCTVDINYFKMFYLCRSSHQNPVLTSSCKFSFLFLFFSLYSHGQIYWQSGTFFNNPQFLNVKCIIWAPHFFILLILQKLIYPFKSENNQMILTKWLTL